MVRVRPSGVRLSSSVSSLHSTARGGEGWGGTARGGTSIGALNSRINVNAGYHKTQYECTEGVGGRVGAQRGRANTASRRDPQRTIVSRAEARDASLFAWSALPPPPFPPLFSHAPLGAASSSHLPPSLLSEILPKPIIPWGDIATTLFFRQPTSIYTNGSCRTGQASAVACLSSPANYFFPSLFHLPSLSCLAPAPLTLSTSTALYGEAPGRGCSRLNSTCDVTAKPGTRTCLAGWWASVLGGTECRAALKTVLSNVYELGMLITNHSNI